MFLYKNRIVVTGGTGRFGNELMKIKSRYQLFFPKKKELNILKVSSIIKYLRSKKPKYLIHLAGFFENGVLGEVVMVSSTDHRILR